MKIRSTITAICIVLVFISCFILNVVSVSAETKTFIKEYTYQAGDEDSKNSCRVIALREVKRLLLEELGTYLKSETEVKNFQLTKDQIITLTAGIVGTELIEDKWDGKTYWLKAKISANPGDVTKAIDNLRKDRQKTKELEDVRKKSDALLKENERLRRELATSKGEKKKKETKAYNKTIKDLKAAEWFEIAYQFLIAEHWKGALDAFTKAIELNPQDANAYSNRGLACDKLGNYQQAIKDYNKAIKLNPQYATVYINRGIAYAKLGNTKQGIKDFNKTIELNPQNSLAYYNKGIAYAHLGNIKQAIENYKIAARLEHKGAQDLLKSNGIEW